MDDGGARFSRGGHASSIDADRLVGVDVAFERGPRRSETSTALTAAVSITARYDGGRAHTRWLYAVIRDDDDAPTAVSELDDAERSYTPRTRW